jgi:hypothetical protein
MRFSTNEEIGGADDLTVHVGNKQRAARLLEYPSKKLMRFAALGGRSSRPTKRGCSPELA